MKKGESQESFRNLLFFNFVFVIVEGVSCVGKLTYMSVHTLKFYKASLESVYNIKSTCVC